MTTTATQSLTASGDLDFEKFAIDLMLQGMIRDSLDANEDSEPIVNSEIARIVAHSLSGWGN
jgi:hypothetical protein